VLHTDRKFGLFSFSKYYRVSTGVFSSFDIPGASATLPMDINDHGQIVGVYGDSDSIPHSFLLENGHFTSIEVPFPHVVFTDVGGINNRGQIAGRYVTLDPAFSHGVIATPKSEPKNIAQLFMSQPNNVSRAEEGATTTLRLSLDRVLGGAERRLCDTGKAFGAPDSLLASRSPRIAR
jgi:hypothetical protein